MAEERRDAIVAFLQGIIEATRWIYGSANDEKLLALTKGLTQAEGAYRRRALDYMRMKKVFSADLSIPDKAFAKSIELAQKAAWRTTIWRQTPVTCLTIASAWPP